MSRAQQSASAVVRNILDGTEEIVCHRGTHQYSDGGIFGVSACGLAALNFARIIFEKERECGRDEGLLQAIIAKETVQNITDICAGWSSDLHLDVEDICRVPLFDQTLQLIATKYGQPDLEQFTILLQELQGIRTGAVVIITRPPEIIACSRLVIHSRDVFIIFDSHARPSHPDGAGFILNTSIHRTAARLSELMPVDGRLLAEGDLQWQAQLLANYSGHIFVSKGPAHLMQTVIESSLAILAMRAEIADLRLQNSTLTTASKRMEAEMEQMEDERREERRRRIQSFKDHASSSYGPASTSVQINNAVAGPSRLNHPLSSRPPAYSPRSEENFLLPLDDPFSDGHNGLPIGRNDNDAVLREQAQLDPERESAEAAAQMQREFDEEDRRLRAQMEEITMNLQREFQCSVCLDAQLEDYVARLEPCGHCFCRDCIRNHVVSKIAENRYPIFCPVCMTETETREGEPGVVTDLLVQQIGITEGQYRIWVELELARFSVLLHCRKCQRTAVVDRQDLETATTLVCPLPDCPYMWCKTCQQEITVRGATHTCDGSSELDHLMKEQGWKYCPSCKTPFQKSAGCNHMTCRSPGCNTHFCYRCGELIIRSALTKAVSTATVAHYNRCKMFA